MAKNKEPSNKKKRRGWLIPLGIVLLLALFGLVMAGLDASARREIAEMEIGQVDFGSLSDGTYTGVYTGGKSHMRDVSLEVTVQNGTVTSVTILSGAVDQNGNPVELNNGVSAQEFLNRALEAQTLEIDAVSGATLTSKALLKALENALLQAY